MTELPCVKCGNAAVRVSFDGLAALIPPKILYAMRGAARFAGRALDMTHPSFGLDAGEISEAIGATCIACADAESGATDNLMLELAEARRDAEVAKAPKLPGGPWGGGRVDPKPVDNNPRATK